MLHSGYRANCHRAHPAYASCSIAPRRCSVSRPAVALWAHASLTRRGVMSGIEIGGTSGLNGSDGIGTDGSSGPGCGGSGVTGISGSRTGGHSRWGTNSGGSSLGRTGVSTSGVGGTSLGTSGVHSCQFGRGGLISGKPGAKGDSSGAGDGAGSCGFVHVPMRCVGAARPWARLTGDALNVGRLRTTMPATERITASDSVFDLGLGHIVATSGATFAEPVACATFAGSGGVEQLEQGRKRAKIELFEAETARRRTGVGYRRPQLAL